MICAFEEASVVNINQIKGDIPSLISEHNKALHFGILLFLHIIISNPAAIALGTQFPSPITSNILPHFDIILLISSNFNWSFAELIG